jgi:hypothetical protein
VIILVDLGALFVSVPHYLVVVGFDGEGFYAHTGYEEMKFYPSQGLDKIWGRMGKMGLVVYPPEAVLKIPPRDRPPSLKGN